MGVLVGLQLIEAWKPVLKRVVEFFVVATQVRMNLSEVNAQIHPHLSCHNEEQDESERGERPGSSWREGCSRAVTNRLRFFALFRHLQSMLR